ncbi:hypothetical protein VVD49_07735 [Uliginosibacterium sp. H3]|uniref:Uncharacterized protein n=1 Tax=Uliginosibacterium silvisoli TaxID=3114758 RepID=A0ABU6K254_9RHOO|nr:hypothetical protein [Uliginosibacterium sp. H3]
MKIGIFGNTNNSPFMLAKALKRLGCEIRLVVNRPEALHRPESKDRELEKGYPAWIADFAALTSSYLVTESPLIPEVMRFLGDGLDAVILNDVGLALNDGRFDCPVLAMLTGSDLLYHASDEALNEATSGWPAEWFDTPAGQKIVERIRHAIDAQREGIRRADAINFMPPGVVPQGDAMLRSLGVGLEDSRRFALRIADTDDLKSRPFSPRRRMRILNGARIIWHRPLPPGFSDLDHKGTDLLIKGFAAFRSKGGEGQLRLVNKGYDVERTRQLIAELDIAADVVWLDELSHVGFYEEIVNADVVCDQFGTSMPGMVTIDALTLGRVVLANFRLECLGTYYPEPRPFLDAATPEEICDALWALYSEPSKRTMIGQRAGDYMRASFSPDACARQLLERLGLKLM